ncbi:MAG: Eco57I restriction-modification methylase domain-containing protein [Cuniculiplasma sp.]
MTEPEKKEDYNIDFERVVELISKYEQIKKSGEIKRYNEESTKKDFILPLFEALGWNVYNRGKKNDSISAEETISKKRVDYGFRINGIPKFFLEAKSLKEENIDTNPKYVAQAIDYAWMKSYSWAILTNFETIAVYNADWKSGYFGGNLFFVLNPSDFLNDNGSDKRFEFLSKIAFENNEIDKLASKYGKKQVKNPINKQLLQDMIHFREILSRDILRNNQDKHLSQDDLDESVQIILDRLIFIRNAEDRELEENKLQSIVRQWSAKGKGQLVKELWDIYKYYDSTYNSKLFGDKEKHMADELIIDNEALQEVIEGLNHSKDNSYRYDFSIIESDVLGNIYEQYLGNILKSTPKRAKLESSKTHRKEQGIYYTPSYIVNYIIKNTVGEYIKTHTPEEILRVRILDPACGSGSFLIRAYKELENYWRKELKLNEEGLMQTRFDSDNSERVYTLKTDILRNNIFGVDLDPKAIEIAQLNLLLQISETKHKLPLLRDNIKVGNSLIDDPNISNRAFKWEKQFPEIMKEGGFDIVIGNPPYIRIQEIEEKEISFLFHQTKISEGYLDTYMLFTETAVNLLRENGLLSFIMPLKFLTSNYGKGLRKFLLESGQVIKIIDFGDLPVFESATTYSGILVLRKTIIKNENLNFYKQTDLNLVKNGLIEHTEPITIRQSSLSETPWFFSDKKEMKLVEKLDEAKTKLMDVCEKIYQGLITSADSVFILRIKNGKLFSESLGDYVSIEPQILKNLVKGLEIKRYGILNSDRFLFFPYEKEFKNKYELIPEETLRLKFPLAYNYLIKNKETLLERSDVISNSISWYAFSRPQNLEEFENIKILTPFNAFNNSFTIDELGKWFFTAGVAGGYGLKLKNSISYKYLLGILNSKLVEFYVKMTSTYLRGKYYSYEHRFIKNVPIIFGNSNEVKEIEQLVNNIISLQASIETTMKNTEKYSYIKSRIEEIENRIDKSIYHIYGLRESDKDIVDSVR